MHFGFTNSAIRQAHKRSAFKFSPSSGAILFSYAGNITNGAANCYRFDLFDFSDDLKVHALYSTHKLDKTKISIRGQK